MKILIFLGIVWQPCFEKQPDFNLNNKIKLVILFKFLAMILHFIKCKLKVLEQVRRYRIRIKKVINDYSGKMIKIYRFFLEIVYLGLGGPYCTKIIERYSYIQYN